MHGPFNIEPNRYTRFGITELRECILYNPLVTSKIIYAAYLPVT